MSHVHDLQDTQRTLGLRIAALEPANLLRGRIAKLLIVASGYAICSESQANALAESFASCTVKRFESRSMTNIARQWQLLEGIQHLECLHCCRYFITISKSQPLLKCGALWKEYNIRIISND